ncbi:MAG: hydrolase [Oscillospiraceae bacterium]|nr:hydrolase [Oscillospiraceae bacterium]
MKNNSRHIITIAAMLIALLALIAASCGTPLRKPLDDPSPPPVETTPGIDADAQNEDPLGTDTMPDDTTTPVTKDDGPPPSVYPGPDVELFPYNGIVEHIFFHEVIAYPSLAFDGDSQQKNFDTNMVTVSEFKKIIESLYSKNYILVNINDVWSEYTNDDGEIRMRRNALMLPDNKKPIIISFDDISFYEYMQSNGFMHKLIIGEDGEIWAVGVDPDGNPVTSQDLAVVTIIDKFVKEHPDFSLGGAKGCIALTGYEGILGYRTQFDVNNNTPAAKLNRMQEIARVRPVISKLKSTGWYFASHSYGHIAIDKKPLEEVKADATRWMDEVGSLVGETKIFLYPFGARLDGDDVDKTGPAFKFYHDLGFRVFASVGYESYVKIKTDIAAVICDRISIDGTRLRNYRNEYNRFYNVAEVFDDVRPAEYDKKW